LDDIAPEAIEDFLKCIQFLKRMLASARR